MNVNLKRFLSLLLAVVLVLGLPSQAMAATNVGSSETTATQPTDATEPVSTEASDPTEPVEPEETTEPAVTEETESEPTDTPTTPDVTEPEATETPTEPTEHTEPTEPLTPEEQDMIRWAELEAQLPDPIEEYFPFAPEIKYPYGEPQDNFYPSSLFEADPYALMPLADMSAIPDNMYDNAILRALAYTGYDVQWLKNNGFLYVAEYVSSNINNYRPAVLSDIGYDDYAPFLNGDETVADSSTVTGRAPNIASFESSGLVCASFVSYYINNYLPNIEGYNTSHIHEAIKATTSTGTGYSTASVWSWETGLTNLANTPGSGVTKYTNETEGYANLVPGDIIVFSRDGELVHVAIYAGTYSMWNIRGTNRGEKHFIIHVGNSRGPEISTTEYLAKSGTAKSSVATAWYHLELGSVVDQVGFIEVYKKDPNGNNLSGARFKAVDQDTGDTFYIGPTDANGYAKSSEMPLDTYVVTEIVFPDGFQASGQSEWTVTLSETTPNLTVTINAVNDPITGSLTIQKASNTGAGLAGWQFGVYTDAACTKPITGSPYTSGSNGSVTISNLSPATYYVKELSGSTDYWACDNEVKTVKVQGNKTATVTITNTHYGYGKIQKKTNTGADLSGWKFNIYSDSGCTQLVSGSPFTSDANGTIVTRLLPGNYWCVEVDESGQFPDWEYDTTVRKLTVTAGKTSSVTFTNSHYGYVKIIKETNTGKNLSGWKFNIYTDAGCTQLLDGSPFVSGADGTITTRILPGDYFIVEADESDKYPDWVFDSSIHVVTVRAGETASVTIRNSQHGKLKLIKSMPDGGSVSGWEFEVYRISDDSFIGSFTSGEDGTILVDRLHPGDYRIVEKIPDNSIYYCEAANPQTVTVAAGQTAEVTFSNRLKPAEISIQKVDTAGNPLAGAVFLLEWSSDGVNWSPVTYTDSPHVTEGTCTAVDLLEGCLTSPVDGIVRFTGLHPERYYRLSEISAPDGYLLLAGAAFEGTIPIDKGLTITLTVVNAPVYELPMTGSKSFVVMAVSLCICIAGCVGALVYLRRKEQ